MLQHPVLKYLSTCPRHIFEVCDTSIIEAAAMASVKSKASSFGMLQCGLCCRVHRVSLIKVAAASTEKASSAAKGCAFHEMSSCVSHGHHKENEAALYSLPDVYPQQVNGIATSLRANRTFKDNVPGFTPFYFSALTRSKTIIISQCGVCGNMSTGIACTGLKA